MQIFGGAGYMRESEINRLYRAAKLLEIGAGTSEIRKLDHWRRIDAGDSELISPRSHSGLGMASTGRPIGVGSAEPSPPRRS